MLSVLFLGQPQETVNKQNEDNKGRNKCFKLLGKFKIKMDKAITLRCPFDYFENKVLVSDFTSTKKKERINKVQLIKLLELKCNFEYIVFIYIAPFPIKN